MNLPKVALVRLVQPAREILGNKIDWLSPNVPISRAAWATGVEQAMLVGDTTVIETELRELLRAGSSGDPAELRKTSLDLANRVSEIKNDMKALSAFRPARESGLYVAAEKLQKLAIDALDHVTLEPVNISASRQDFLTTQAGLTSSSIDFPDDMCSTVFGIEREHLENPDGTFSPSRLFGRFYGRYGELQNFIDSIFQSFATHSPGIHDGIMPAWTLMNCSQPLTAMRSALFAREVIQLAFAADPESSGRVLRTYKLRVDRSKANHAGIIRTQLAQREAVTGGEKAELSLDLYRRVIEGQFRPWAWTLLQLRGRSGSRLPELSALRDQLIADKHRVLKHAADALLPAVRNAAAHEDFLWDEVLEKIQVGESVTTVEEVEEATMRAYEFMMGCELAIVSCLSESDALVSAMSLEDPVDGSRTINLGAAINMFGTNGLQVRSHRLDRGLFTVELEEWPRDRINPGFQALITGAKILQQAERFQIRVTGQDSLAVDLPRGPLDANFTVWRQAITHFSLMPPSTFLPVNVAARIEVEGREQAARSATRLALTDALEALSLLESKNRRHLKKAWSHVSARFSLIEHSFKVTKETCQLHGSSDIDDALKRIERLTEELSKQPQDVAVPFLASLVKGIEKIWEAIDPVSVFPLVDDTPV